MSTLGSFIWSIADQLRGPYRPNQYGNVILPFTILRRLDCILEPDRDDGARAGGEVRQPEPAQGRGQEGHRAAVLQHLELRLRQPPGRRRRAGGQPGRLHRPVLAPTSTCSSTSTSRRRSSPWRRRGSCARSSSPSRPSTCTRTSCPTPTWAMRSSTSSASSTRPRTRPPVTTTPRGTRSGCWSTCSSPRRTPT